MSEKPKPLTKAEWEQMKTGYTLPADDIATLDDRIDATLDALFAYRERTRGMGLFSRCHNAEEEEYGWHGETDAIAADLGLK